MEVHDDDHDHLTNKPCQNMFFVSFYKNNNQEFLLLLYYKQIVVKAFNKTRTRVFQGHSCSYKVRFFYNKTTSLHVVLFG